MKTNNIITIIAATLVMTGCSCDPVEVLDHAGEGHFSLNLQAGDINVDVVTRADITVDTEAFLVHLKNANGDKLIDGKKKADLIPADYNVQSGTGYAISAESCTAEDATQSNGGWGAPRFCGETTFDVESGQTTAVTLPCTLQNAGMTLDVQESFLAKFPIYSITTEDGRSLVWSKDAVGNIAYYDMSAETSTLSLRIVGSQGGWEDRLNISKTVTLTRGKVNKVALSYDDDSGNVDIEIKTDQDVNTEDSETTVE